MAIKDILLLLDSDGEGQPASAYAGALAHELGAHLTAAGIAFEILAPAAFAGDYPYEMLAAITEQSRERAAKAYEKLRAASPESLRSELVQIDALPGQARDDFARLARHFRRRRSSPGPGANSDDELLAGIRAVQLRAARVVRAAHPEQAAAFRARADRMGWQPRRRARIVRRDAAT